MNVSGINVLYKTVNKRTGMFPTPYGRKKLEIGKKYEVYCIMTYPDKTQFCWIPILGLPHVDSPEVNEGSDPNATVGNNIHQHLDYRFATKREIRLLDWRRGVNMATIIGEDKLLNKGDTLYVKGTWEVRPFLRDFPSFFTNGKRTRFAHKFMGKPLKNKKCPHQGIDLSQVKPVVDIFGRKCLICPGHGLCFDAITEKCYRS